MKINFEFDDNEVVYEVMNAMFIAYLKNFKKDCIKYAEDAWNEEDRHAYEKLDKACDTILNHFEVPNGTRD